MVWLRCIGGRKEERVTLEVRPLPLEKYEDGDMKEVISHWAYGQSCSLLVICFQC